MNNCVFIGRFTKDPEMKTFDSGSKRASTNLAVNREFSKDEADFIPVVFWNKTAETVVNHLHKGSLVAVRGSLQQRSYEKDGEKRTVFEVVVNNIEFLERVKKDEDKQKPAEVPPLLKESEEEYIEEENIYDDAEMLPFDIGDWGGTK